MSLRKQILLGLSSWLLLAVAAPAQDKVVEKKEGDPKSDREFLVWAIANEVAEVKFAEKALKQTSNDDVKQLARKLADEHTKTRDAFVDKAKAMKLVVVQGLEKRHKDIETKLGKLEGAEFDREYLRVLVDSHGDSMKMYTTWAKKADDEGLRDIAGKALLHAKAHEDMARQLKGKLDK